MITQASTHPKGLIIAAPSSGSGKTLVTLGLLRALKNKGVNVVSAKAGPDYIDPAFHAAASGHPCINLDYWAMGDATVYARATEQSSSHDLLIIEGVMGLFDGPIGATGSTADLAASLRLPVVLIIDAARQGQSIAAVAQGFNNFRSDVKIAGVILNRVASDRHESMLRASLGEIGVKIIGVVRQIDSLEWPSRHLGLVLPEENQLLERFIETAASEVARETIIDNTLESAVEFSNQAFSTTISLPPLAQSIAIARDDAFSFAYPHLIQDWRNQGAEISFFSPLTDEIPVANSQSIFLPGGYPELHTGKLASNHTFLTSLHKFTGPIYGECGGYMVLGDGLIDKQGTVHKMAGLLPLTTNFAKRKLSLGYRQLQPLNSPWNQPLRGHEFHYSTIESQGGGLPLFHAKDAAGNDLGQIGQRVGNVMGSYAHIISEAPK
jgi:cobyrinic acid a,c-diamide synthase